MADLHAILERYVRDGSVPGAVGLVARGDRTEVAAVGLAGVGGAPMSVDSIFRLASVTKPITAAAVMILVEDGLDGQGWGFGGSVDVAAVDPWNVMGRYGWVGGTGTSAHIIPSPAWSPSCSPRWRRTARLHLSGCRISGGTPPAAADAKGIA